MEIVLGIGVVLAIAVMGAGTLILLLALWQWYRREMLPVLSEAPAWRVAATTAGVVSILVVVLGVLIWQPLGQATIVLVMGSCVVLMLGGGLRERLSRQVRSQLRATGLSHEEPQH